MLVYSPRMNEGRVVFQIRARIALVVFAVLGVFLFASELMNAIFNSKLDAEGFSLAERVVFAFKPTVIGIFLVFSLMLYLLIMWYLKPLVRYLRTGEAYTKARKAAINVPWVIIVFQLAAWTLGTTLYYYLKGWNAESGIPYFFGLPLKLAVGFPCGVYVSILFNLILIPAKQRLRIHHMGEGENDLFSRNRDYFVVVAILIFIVVNFMYIAFYYAQATTSPTINSFFLPLLAVAVFYGAASIGLIALSKREYFIQIDSVRSILQRMATGKTLTDTRIDIINYNELGEIAAHANRIVDNFQTLLSKVSQTSENVYSSSRSLLAASNHNSSHASEQASSTTQIVATMERVNSLSTEIGNQARMVDESANRMKAEINDGFSSIKKTTDTMEAVRRSNSDTITQVEKLTEQVQNIWEIVEMIGAIARKIRIIAFNAAIEAASAGEAGKGFEVIATDIRTLADNTVDSTGKIRDRIEQIQAATETLIESSQADTEHIQEAWTLSKEQESVFDSLLELSESSSNAAEAMSDGVNRQIESFEQVLSTLRQISNGISEFSNSIGKTNRTADSLNETVLTLNEIVKESGAVEEAGQESNV